MALPQPQACQAPRQKASAVATRVASGPLHTLEAPSLQGPRPPRPFRLLASSSQTHFTSQPLVPAPRCADDGPCPAGLPVRGRLSQWKASSSLLSQPRLPPSPQGPRLELQGTHCWGPDARPLLCEHGHPLLASSPSALTAPGAMLRALGTDDNWTDFGANKEPRSAAGL